MGCRQKGKKQGGYKLRQALVVLVVAVLVFFTHGSFAAGAVELDRVVAVVNNEAITWLELYKAMELEIKRRIREPLSPEARLKLMKENEAAFLEEMINVRLQLAEAKRLNIQVSDSELAAAIKSIMEANSMNESEFEAALKAEGLSLKEYKARLREEITLRRLIDREVRSLVVITDEDVISALGKKVKDIEMPSYKISQILFTAEGAEERAQKAYERLRSGEDFAILAQELSEDPAANATVADLGYINSEDLAPEFQTALSRMKKGDISEPFRTETGIHIIRLEDIKTSRAVEEMREKLFEEAMTRQYLEWLRRLREQAFVEIKL